MEYVARRAAESALGDNALQSLAAAAPALPVLASAVSSSPAGAIAAAGWSVLGGTANVLTRPDIVRLLTGYGYWRTYVYDPLAPKLIAALGDYKIDPEYEAILRAEEHTWTGSGAHTLIEFVAEVDNDRKWTRTQAALRAQLHAQSQGAFLDALHAIGDVNSQMNIDSPDGKFEPKENAVAALFLKHGNAPAGIQFSDLMVFWVDVTRDVLHARVNSLDEQFGAVAWSRKYYDLVQKADLAIDRLAEIVSRIANYGDIERVDLSDKTLRNRINIGYTMRATANAFRLQVKGVLDSLDLASLALATPTQWTSRLTPEEEQVLNTRVTGYDAPQLREMMHILLRLLGQAVYRRVEGTPSAEEVQPITEPQLCLMQRTQELFVQADAYWIALETQTSTGTSVLRDRPVPPLFLSHRVMETMSNCVADVPIDDPISQHPIAKVFTAIHGLLDESPAKDLGTWQTKTKGIVRVEKMMRSSWGYDYIEGSDERDPPWMDTVGFLLNRHYPGGLERGFVAHEGEFLDSPAKLEVYAVEVCRRMQEMFANLGDRAALSWADLMKAFEYNKQRRQDVYTKALMTVVDSEPNAEVKQHLAAWAVQEIAHFKEHDTTPQEFWGVKEKELSFAASTIEWLKSIPAATYHYFYSKAQNVWQAGQKAIAWMYESCSTGFTWVALLSYVAGWNPSTALVALGGAVASIVAFGAYYIRASLYRAGASLWGAGGSMLRLIFSACTWLKPKLRLWLQSLWMKVSGTGLLEKAMRFASRMGDALTKYELSSEPDTEPVVQYVSTVVYNWLSNKVKGMTLTRVNKPWPEAEETEKVVSVLRQSDDMPMHIALVLVLM